MSVLECSPERPWGVHVTVYNDGPCGRCGWVAPGPISDHLDQAREAAAALEQAEALGWTDPPRAAA